MAQVTDRFPVRFGQYYQEKAMVNPAAANYASNLDGNVGYLSFFGSFSEVRTFYGSLHKNLNASTKGVKNSLGVLLYGDKEGEVLSRSRAYLNYAIHIPIREKFTLAAGAYLGIVSFSTKGTQVTAGASDAAPDGALGIWGYSDSWYAGFSLNQLFNLTLKPIEQEFLLQRHVNFLAGYEFKGINHRFLTHGNIRLTKDAVFDVGELVKLYNKYLLGIAYRHTEGVQLSAGVQQLNVGEGHLSFQFSYQFPFKAEERANIQSYELTLNYLID